MNLPRPTNANELEQINAEDSRLAAVVLAFTVSRKPLTFSLIVN